MMRTRGWAQLPSELLEMVLEAAKPLFDSEDDEGEAMQHSLRLRLRCEAVCSHWQAALRPLPVHTVDIHEVEPPGLLEWLISRRPRVQNLHIDATLTDSRTASRMAMVLYSLGGQNLQQLHLAMSICDTKDSLLPSPAVFRSLTELHFGSFQWDLGWLEQLNRLPHLRRLQLRGVWIPNSELLTMPRLPRLTSLAVILASDNSLRIPLANLPALQHLDISAAGVNTFAEVLGGASHEAEPQLQVLPPCAVTHLRLDVFTAAVDFVTMPALQSLELRCPRLDGLDTLATATSLRQLQLESTPDGEGLFGEDGEPLEHWAVEVLGCMQPSLRCLPLRGDWPMEVTSAVGTMGMLRVLCLDGSNVPPGPLTDAPVWKGLRALRLSCEYSAVFTPMGLVHAKELERLELHKAGPTKQSLRLLASLSSLRHLWLGYRVDATTSLARLRTQLPQLESLRTLRKDGRSDGFVEPAVAQALRDS